MPLRLFDEFSSLAEVFLSGLGSFSGDAFLDFFEADFSVELAGLPLFLPKRIHKYIQASNKVVQFLSKTIKYAISELQNPHS